MAKKDDDRIAVNARIKRETIEKIDLIAEKTYRNRTQVITMALDEYAENYKFDDDNNQEQS